MTAWKEAHPVAGVDEGRLDADISAGAVGRQRDLAGLEPSGISPTTDSEAVAINTTLPVAIIPVPVFVEPKMNVPTYARLPSGEMATERAVLVTPGIEVVSAANDVTTAFVAMSMT